MTNKKYWRIGLIVLIIGLLAFGGAMTGFGADRIGPILISGNDPAPSVLWNEYEYGCEDLIAFKINQQNPNGTFSDGVLTVTVSTPDKFTGLTWSSNIPVYYVFAKGGANGNLYIYPDGEISDSGILAPLTGGTRGPRADISHITFYYCPFDPASICVEKKDADSGDLLADWTFELFKQQADDSWASLGERTTGFDNDTYVKACWDGLYSGTYKVVEKPTQDQIDAGWVSVDPADGIWQGDLAAGQDLTLTFENRIPAPEYETAMARMVDCPVCFIEPFNHPWFTYLKIDTADILASGPTSKLTYYFYAKTYYKVGEVDIWKVGPKLHLDIRMESGYTLEENHIKVKTTVPSSIAFGTYPYKLSDFPIDWNNAWNDVSYLYITVHGVVSGDFSGEPDLTCSCPNNSNTASIQTFGTMDADNQLDAQSNTVDNEANTSTAPEAPGGGAPAKHGVDGQTFGAVVSGKAQEDPLGLVDHLLEVYKP